MNDYFKARAIYRRNMLIGIGACLYLYAFCSDEVYRVFGTWDAKMMTFWPLVLIALYGVYAWIRSIGGKEFVYGGALRIIPKLFIGYMLICSFMQIISVWFRY